MEHIVQMKLHHNKKNWTWFVKFIKTVTYRSQADGSTDWVMQLGSTFEIYR